MDGLPDLREELATDLLAAGFGVSHDATGGGENGDTHAADDFRDGGVSGVDATARGRDALDAGDGRNAGNVLEGEFEDGKAFALGLAGGGEVTSVNEDLGDAFTKARPLDGNHGLVGLRSVADGGQEIPDGVSRSGHGFVFSVGLPGGLGDAGNLAYIIIL